MEIIFKRRGGSSSNVVRRSIRGEILYVFEEMVVGSSSQHDHEDGMQVHT
jgi:hypothetical protein